MKKISKTLLTVFILSVFLYPVSAYAQSLVANDFTKSTPKDTTLAFSAYDFIKSANPPKGKSLVSVKFNQVTNEASGNLKIKGNIVIKGSTVSVNDLNNLTFVPVQGYEGEAIFTWTANYGGTTSPYPGAVIITIGSGAKAPSILQENKNENKNESENESESEQIKQENKETVEQEEKPKSEEKKETVEKKPIAYNKIDHEKGLKPLRYEDMLTHWGAYSAGMLASRGYVIGEDYGNNFYFRPEEKITRLDYILMINSIFGIEPAESLADNPFSDKNVPDYILKVATSAYSFDVIEGMKGKDGKMYLNPYDPISRAEAVTIIDYALRLDTHGVDDAEFTDVKKIPDWAIQSVKNLEAYGIIQGYEDGTFRPNNLLTRAQAGEIVWQALKFLDLKRSTSQVLSTIIYGD